MNILVAVDESELSRHALQQALQLINHQGATFLLLSVEEPVVMPPPSPVLDVFGEQPTLNWQEQHDLVQLEENRTEAALHWSEQLCQQAGVAYVSRSTLGDAKHTICDMAKQENCDLIVVGSHGYGVVDRMLLGSVSDYVVHHASCPVLVVR